MKKMRQIGVFWTCQKEISSLTSGMSKATKLPTGWFATNTILILDKYIVPLALTYPLGTLPIKEKQKHSYNSPTHHNSRNWNLTQVISHPWMDHDNSVKPKEKEIREKKEEDPGILSISNSTPSLARTKSSPTKATGIPFPISCGFSAILSLFLQ